MIEIPNNGNSRLWEAHIDPEAWLESMADRIDLDEPCDNPTVWPDSIEVRHAIERHELAIAEAEADPDRPTEFQMVAHDNVYNSENDFGNHFVYAVYAPSGVDRDEWYHSDSLIIATSLGKSGDPRGTYWPVSLWRMKWDALDSSFFDWCIGWRVEVGADDDWINADPEGRCSIGYSEHPTSEASRLVARWLRDSGAEVTDQQLQYGIDDAGEWADGLYIVELADGRSLRLHPYSQAEFNG